jgi:hypothetical protein
MPDWDVFEFLGYLGEGRGAEIDFGRLDGFSLIAAAEKGTVFRTHADESLRKRFRRHIGAEQRGDFRIDLAIDIVSWLIC